MKTKKEGSELWVQDTIRAMLWSECGIQTDKIPGSTLLKGHPDLICGCAETGIFYIEVKAPKKKLRWTQVDWCERWDGAAHIYVVDHPSKLWSTVFLDKDKLRLAANRWRWAVPGGQRLQSALSEWAAPTAGPASA